VTNLSHCGFNSCDNIRHKTKFSHIFPLTITVDASHSQMLPKSILTLALATLASVSAAPRTFAGTGPDVSSQPLASIETKTPTLAESLDNLGRLYSNKENPIMQEFWLLGRYHGQQHWSEGNEGEKEESWENRRFRVGAQAKFFNKLTLHAQMVSGSDFEPFYNGFTELWAQWSFHEALNLTIGQQKHRFTHDRNVSSRYLNYMERSMLTNTFGLDYTPAVTLSGKFGNFSYYTGLFSNTTGTDIEKAFTELNAGWTYLASVTYDLTKKTQLDSAYLNVGYIHSQQDDDATLFNRYRDGISAALILTEGPASLVTEYTAGIAGKDGSAQGINIQPSFFITDKLQFVARYQLATSNQDEGLNAQRRYERNVGLGKGNLYQAAYAGFNYHIIGHRLKLMTGVEYATISGKDSWTAMTAIRLFWGPHSKGPFPMAQTLNGAW
jgi:phosphate-selective porin OprO and OprP